MDLTKRFNKQLDKIQVSLIRQFDQAISEIPGILRLTLGEPDFTTPNHIKEAAKKAILEQGDKLKAVILNYPANPTGITYSREQLEDLAAVLRKYEIFIEYSKNIVW